MNAPAVTIYFMQLLVSEKKTFPGLIRHFRFVFLILLVFLSHSSLSSSQSPSSTLTSALTTTYKVTTANASSKSFIPGTRIPQHDQWCKENCFNIETCNETFQNNYVDLQIQTSHTIRDGPGQHLIYDNTFLGTTISKQSFVTQFVLDISETTLGISPCKVHVLDILSLGGDYKNIVIVFRLYEIVHDEIHELTRQIQNLTSLFYTGKVTSATDELIGLVIPNWDFSVRLRYAIDMIGRSDTKTIKNELVLNQGSERWCKDAGENELDILLTDYCEFELLFEKDIVKALSSSANTTVEEGQAIVLFVKSSGMDGIIVSCRFMPLAPSQEMKSISPTMWAKARVDKLVEMIHDDNSDSILYNGEVTFRLDPSWGISLKATKPRVSSKRLNRSVRPTPKNKYLRCKDTHRCSRGWNYFNQTSFQSTFTMQLFSGGEHKPIPLFADFENWRQGTQGWEKRKRRSDLKPEGSHWSPFEYESLGPTVPSFNTSSNSGLVLNAERLFEQIQKQETWILEIEDYIDWVHSEMNVTSLEAHTRFRRDIHSEMEVTLNEYKKILLKEKEKKSKLENSQCAIVNKCRLLFNTSDLTLTGAINATGTIGKTPDGTEVAVWTFDSIDIGREVSVNLTGQRALALLSKSSVFIDTNFTAIPGTLGGFPGGYSVSRIDRLNSVCNQDTKDESFMCSGDYSLSHLNSNTISNNINGPGSGSMRIYSFTIESSGAVVHEVQSIVTDAMNGQIINGGFVLHFNGHSTPFIPHDITAKKLQAVMEDSLNAAKINALGSIDRENFVPGIGKIRVSRHHNGSSGGYEWKITFLTAVGNIGDQDSSPLTVTNLLNGIGASISIYTLVNGNTIGGTFGISFLNNHTRQMDHDISAQEMKEIILKDFSQVTGVEVIRSGKLGSNCNDGLCNDGPHQSGGYKWSLFFTTIIGNRSPSSPTSIKFDKESSFANLTVSNNLLGCIDDRCPNITVRMGHDKYMQEKKIERPFSISIGGGGAGFGGDGGEGFGTQPNGKSYGDKQLTNLLGGSGGALGFTHPFDTLMVGLPGRSRGGSGGGAIEIIAINEILLGPNAIISCNGEKGWIGFTAGGGGGSGGAILLSANDNLNIKGILDAKGGDGSTPAHNGKNPTYQSGGGGGGGRIALYGKTITTNKNDVSGGICRSTNEGNKTEHCDGKSGTIQKEQIFSHSMTIDEKNGAAGTNHSLHLKAANSKMMQFWFDPRNKYRQEGPEFVFDEASRPGRVSFFIKFGSFDGQVATQSWGATIMLKDRVDDSSNKITSEALCLSIGRTTQHGFATVGGEHNINLNMRPTEFKAETQFNHWYYADIRLDWKSRLYHIYLDNILLVQSKELKINTVQSFSILLPLSNVDVWLDEIFVGDDSSMDFKCPIFLANDYVAGEGGIVDEEGRGWKQSEFGDPISYKDMTRHESHLSKRPLYNRLDNGGLAPFDGHGHIFYSSDLKSSSSEQENYLKSGSILTLLGSTSASSSSDKTKYFWYREYYNSGFHNRDGLITGKKHYGGVAACSTTDFKHWKNEGIMLHYVNLTDMVSGSNGLFHIERPHVLYNNRTQKFVMWMTIDNVNRTLAMAGVATSDSPNGPFTLVRSFYPDGNRTRDQTLYKDIDEKAYLLRTYYKTIEYTLPAAVMQPIWESAKNKDGSINFPLSYHRAHYEPDYDDFHDIYLQRWRGEDTSWKIVCVNKETQVEREIPYGREGLDVCKNRLEYKKVIGQGSPRYHNSRNGVRSRFLDPNRAENNVWKPSSVPNVRSQNWKANYNEGSCGRYLIGDDLQRYDPNLPHREASNRDSCSNVADNPVHPTYPDQRVGAEELVQKRRAKYVAVSLLTEDYLDTTGVLMSYEGELENGTDISFLVTEAKKNLFPEAGNSIQSTYFERKQREETYKKTRTEWDTEDVHQYEKRFNDRSFYSLACVLDGKCPPNFREKE